MAPTQHHTDQAGAPRGMLATQFQGFCDQRTKLPRVRVSPARIGRSDRRFAGDANPVQQMTHRAAGQIQRPRDQRSILTLLGSLDNDMTQRQRNGMWHEQSSHPNLFNHDAHDTVSFVTGAAKPCVGIARQNQLTVLRGKTMCRD
jgi:hypothetical protein